MTHEDPHHEYTVAEQVSPLELEPARQQTIALLLDFLKDPGKASKLNGEMWGQNTIKGVNSDNPNIVATMTTIKALNEDNTGRIVTNYRVLNIPDGLQMEKTATVWGAEHFTGTPTKHDDSRVQELESAINATTAAMAQENELGLSFVSQREAGSLLVVATKPRLEDLERSEI